MWSALPICLSSAIRSFELSSEAIERTRLGCQFCPRSDLQMDQFKRLPTMSGLNCKRTQPVGTKSTEMPLCHLERPRECSGSMPNILTHYQQNVEKELQASTLRIRDELYLQEVKTDCLLKVHCTTAVIPFKLFKALAAARTLKGKL